MKKLIIIKFIFLYVSFNFQSKAQDTTVTVIGKVWPIEKAKEWYNKHKWINGADFLPSTAINQLEMWQTETFDPATIDRELGWAKNIGFNTMRVYLHSIAWQTDPSGFKNRVNQYLTIANKHNIKTIFVFFDDCWNKQGYAGKQPEPKVGIHNSGWVQDPGDPASKELSNFIALEKYVKDVISSFKSDERILFWDLYNEPGNSNKFTTSFPLLKSVITWARAIDPQQPISIGLWAWNFHSLNAMQAINSDIITYHNYEEPVLHKRTIDMLKAFGRPMICTEYMARTRNSRFSNIMPMLKNENIGAINWGFVAGKSNTIFAWDTPLPNGDQPIEWFHDIFKKDGEPYRKDEIELIKKLNQMK